MGRRGEVSEDGSRDLLNAFIYLHKNRFIYYIFIFLKYKTCIYILFIAAPQRLLPVQDSSSPWVIFIPSPSDQ